MKKYNPKFKKNLLPFPAANYSVIPKDFKTQTKLGTEMIAWLQEHQDVVDLKKFPLSKWMSPYKFYKIAENNPDFAECLEIARSIIATRIGDGWKTSEMNTLYAKEMLPIYDNEYRDWQCLKTTMVIQARQAELQSQDKSASNYTVIIPSIPTTSEVPERKLDETRDRDTFEQVQATILPDTNT